MVVGLSALLAIYAKLFKSRASYSVPDDDRSTITAMIPALNEEQTIPYALTSLAMQTVTPDRVIVVDDGSTDDTPRIVRELSDELTLDIELRQHAEPMGKTVGMKEVARSVETDTLFVLDADTFLESETYLEGVLAPQTEPSVASSFGTVYPIEGDAKQALYERHAIGLLPEDGVTIAHMQRDLESATSRTGPLEYLTSNKPIVQFRNVEYHVQQRFFTDGLMRLFGSTLFPIGCAVLYDRRKLVSVFDAYEASHGDDLTNSEDIFVGFAFCDRGWENVHLGGTYMRSAVPKLRGALRQNYLWGSGFLQSAYYFGRLSRRFRTQHVATDGGERSTGPRSTSEHGSDGSDRPEDSLTPSEQRSDGGTRELEQARPWSEGQRETNETGTHQPTNGDEYDAAKQPMGWAVTTQIIDGLYPTVVVLLLALSIFGFVALDTIFLLMLWEFSLYILLARLTLTERLGFYRNLVPFVVVRFVALPVLTYTYLRVGADIVTGNRNWRK